MPEIPYTKTYLQELTRLIKEHEEGRISDEEYSQRFDELAEKEAKVHKSIEHSLLLQEIRGFAKGAESKVKQEYQQEVQKIAAEEWAREAQRRRKQQQEEERLHQEERKKENERYRYRKWVDNYIDYLDGNTQNLQRLYTAFQIILLAFAAITAGMASVPEVPRWIVTITGIIATIAGGILTTFKIQDRIYGSRKAVAQIILECQRYDYHIGEYENKSDEERYIILSKKITEIQGQEMLGEAERWNPRKEEKKEEEKAAQDKAQGDKGDQESDEIVEKVPQKGKSSEASEKTPQEEKPSDNEK